MVGLLDIDAPLHPALDSFLACRSPSALAVGLLPALFQSGFGTWRSQSNPVAVRQAADHVDAAFIDFS